MSKASKISVSVVGYTLQSFIWMLRKEARITFKYNMKWQALILKLSA